MLLLSGHTLTFLYATLPFFYTHTQPAASAAMDQFHQDGSWPTLVQSLHSLLQQEPR